MANRFSVEAVFKGVDRITAPVTRMQNRISKFSRRVSGSLKAANRQLGKMRDGMKRVGQVAAASALIAGVAFGNVVSTGAEFEQTITSAASTFGILDKKSEVFKDISDTYQLPE